MTASRSPTSRRCKAAGPRGPVVLGAFHGAAEGFLSSGQHRDHDPVRDAEGRAELGGVENRQPSGRAGADVDESAARGESLARRAPRPR